jgi:hypothetical protein
MDSLDEIRARITELDQLRESTEDDAVAREAADEIHALMNARMPLVTFPPAAPRHRLCSVWTSRGPGWRSHRVATP